MLSFSSVSVAETYLEICIVLTFSSVPATETYIKITKGAVAETIAKFFYNESNRHQSKALEESLEPNISRAKFKLLLLRIHIIHYCNKIKITVSPEQILLCIWYPFQHAQIPTSNSAVRVRSTKKIAFSDVSIRNTNRVGREIQKEKNYLIFVKG